MREKRKKRGEKFLSILLALCVVATTGVVTPLNTGAESADSAAVTEQEQGDTASVEEQAPAVTAAQTSEQTEQTSELDAITEADQSDSVDAGQDSAPAVTSDTGTQDAENSDAAAQQEETPDAAAADTQAEQDTVAYPEQNFSGSTDSVTVTVHAPEGVFPEGTTMTVTPVTAETAMSIAAEAADDSTPVVDAVGVDITFLDASGQEIEPKDGQSVDVNMSLIGETTLSGENFEVVHQQDSGAVETVTQDASAEGAAFTANAFSVYVISGKGTAEQNPSVETWNFYGADNSTVISTQSLKNGDTVVSPATPEKDGYVFKGWAESADSATVEMEPFTSRTVTVSTTQTVNWYPVYVQKLYVFFMDTYGRVWQTKEGVTGDAINTADVTLPLGSEESVTGWYTDEGLLGDPVGDVVLADSNVTLYPKVESGHYLYFDSGNGASYVSPQFVAANARTQEPEAPTRPGYTFLGWSSTKNSGSVNFTFGKTLSENTTVYAVWQANQNTSYTVIFWKQSVNDKKDAADNEKTYDYAGSETRTGTSGQAATVTNSDRDKNYAGFTFNSTKSQSVTINGDGSTVLNVYYDRNLLTINFYVPSRRSWYLQETFTGLYGQTLAQNGYTWPNSYRWSSSQYADYGITLTFLDAFIFDDLTDYGSSTEINVYRHDNNGRNTISHYKQNLDGSYSYSSPDNSTISSGGTFYFTNKYNGFTINSYCSSRNIPSDYSNWVSVSANDSARGYDNLYVRYTRNSYKLSFYNNNGISKEENVLYEAPLSAYENYVPDRPSGLADEFTFQGWYKDPELTQPVDFSQTMPAGGVTVYAKWAEPSYTGTVHMTIDGTGTSSNMDIAYGSTISQSDLPTVKDSAGNVVSQGNGETIILPADVDWVGWAEKNGTQYTTFNFSAKIYSDITLYPYYISKAKYTVTYDVNGGSGTVTDDKSYASGAYADVADGAAAPEGKSFLFWSLNQDGTGTSYYPGDKIQVTDNIRLYAVYGDPEKTTSLTYDTNYPADSTLSASTKKQTVNGSETLANNVSFTALSAAEAGFAVPDGYYFAGWNTKAAGDGTSVAAGADILVDANGENILYAQWVKKQALVLTVTGNKYTSTYNGQNQSVSGYTVSYMLDGTEISALPGNLQLDRSAADNKKAAGKDAGTYTMGLASTDFSVIGSDLEKYTVTINVTDGSLLVQRREVTLTSDTASMAYDGTTLTAPNVTIGEQGFVEGEVVSVTAGGSQTEVGTSENKPITINRGTGYKDENYNITEKYGTLEVTKASAEFTIKAATNSKTYDGTALTDSTFSVIKPDGFENYTVNAAVEGTITDAGSTDNVVTSYQILAPDGKDVTAYFAEAKKEKGTLTVTPRKVTLTSRSKTREYDGTALTAPDVTISDPGFVSGEVSNITATGSITKTGSVTNTITYTTSDAFKAGNYEITKNEGTLTVTQNSTKIRVRAASDSKTYDGTALTANKYSLVGLPDGFTLKDVVVTGSATNVSDTEAGNNKVTSAKIMKDDEDVTDQFSDVIYVDGTLTINPRTVTLTSATDVKPYDGTPLTNSMVTIGGDDFVKGEVTDVKAVGTITRVGTVDNIIEYTKGEKFKEENYSITETLGKLTVTKANVSLVITAPSDTFTYDGTVHSTGNTGVTVSWSPEEKGNKYTVEADVAGSVTNVSDGQVVNRISSYKILDADGNDVTDQFDSSRITTVDGTIRVIPRKVTLTSESQSKQYDGTALTAPDVKVTGDGFVTGEVSGITATGSITKVGSVDNTITYKTGTGFDARNYEITKEEGKLTITRNQSEITITAGSSSRKYNGTKLTDGSYTVEGVPDGFTFGGATVTGSATNVSDTKSGNNVVTGGKILKGTEDVTDQFANIHRVDGTLEILPREVTLTSATDQKEYDGEALINSKVDITGDGFVDGEVSDVRATGSITEVGTVSNTIQYTRGDKFLAENYTITEVVGTLTVLSKNTNLVVTSPTQTWVYDGTSHSTGNEITATWRSQENANKYTVTASVSGSVKDVSDGTVVNKIDPDSIRIIEKATGKDVTPNFDATKFTVVNGKLSITARPVTLISQSAQKPYDGTPLTAPEVTGGDQFVAGEVSDIRATGSALTTGDGEVKNIIVYTENDGFKADNYTIEKKEGTLKITQNTSAITVSSADDTRMYDGTPLTNSTITTTGLPEGFTLTATVSGSVTDVDTTMPAGNNTVSAAVIKDKEGNVVTDQFAGITYQPGTLRITPRNVTLTSASDSKPYDGTALTAPDVTVTGDGFVDGEVSDIKATGSVTKKGSVSNTISYTKEKNFKEDNYRITEVPGTLTITAANVALVLTAPSGTWEYDGAAHSTGNTGVTVTWSPEENGSKYTVEAVVEGSVTNVKEGKISNVITSYTIKDKNSGDDVTDQFDKDQIQTVNGTLQVTPRRVVLESKSKEKMYDGTPLTAPRVTVEDGSFVDGEVTDLKATGTITEAGEVANPITWTEGEKFQTENYDIVKTEGTLKVTKNDTEITVTAASAEKMYDGTPLTDTSSTVTGLTDKFTATITVSGSATDVADTAEGNNKVTDVKITRNGKNVTDQFTNIKTVNGTLTITKRPVTLTSESASKPYDGTALTSEKVTVGGSGFVKGEVEEGSIKATGTITEVGETANSITFKGTSSYNEGNYQITKEEGTLTITKAEIAFRVEAASNTWVYDGKSHSDPTIDSFTVPEDQKEVYGKYTVQATVEGSVTNVKDGQVPNKITDVRVYLGHQDVTSQFDVNDIIKVDGVLQITPVTLKLTSETASKEYDGSPLVRDKVQVEEIAGKIVTTNGEAQISNIRATGSVTNVTDAPVKNPVVYDTSADFSQENYQIQVVTGTLAITQNTADVQVTAASDSKTYDGTPLTAEKLTVTGLPGGFTFDGKAGGSITNVWQNAEGNNPVASFRILDKDGKDVTNQFANITKNAGTLTINKRDITLTSDSAAKTYDGTPLTAEHVTVGGKDGLADKYKLTYEFTGTQTYVGQSENTFTYKLTDPNGVAYADVASGAKAGTFLLDAADAEAAAQPHGYVENYNITVKYGTLTVTDDIADPTLAVKKTHDKNVYQVGDEIVFSISVTNIYDTEKNITLTEQDGVVFVESDGQAGQITSPSTFELYGVKPGATVTVTAEHMVNEEDLKKKEYTNTVTAAFSDGGKEWKATDTVSGFAHMTLTKEITNEPGNGAAFVKGETINYRITVTNDGTVDLSQLNVADILTNDEWTDIPSLAPGETVTFETSHKVTGKRAKDGYIANQAVANALDPAGNRVTADDEVKAPYQVAAPSLLVQKTSDVGKGETVAPGDTIHYTITVLNNGNTVVSNVVVTDEMTGDSWEAGTLQPLESKEFKAEYKVTEKDVLAGSVKNVATADGEDPNGDKPNVTPGETEDKTVPENPHLTLTKVTTSTPKDKNGYAVGEIIRYRIDAVNDGNLTLTDVVVTDPLTKESWTVASMAPGEKKNFETSYTVTEADQKAGKVINNATAKGKTPGSKELTVVPGQISDPVLPKQSAVPAKTTSNGSGTTTQITAVQTGDPTRTGAYLAMMLLAAGGVAALIRKKKKENQQ